MMCISGLMTATREVRSGIWLEFTQGLTALIAQSLTCSQNTIVATGSGKDQAQVDYHITHEVYGVKAVSAVVGDNASTQSGATKSHAVELVKLFAVRTVFVG